MLDRALGGALCVRISSRERPNKRRGEFGFCFDVAHAYCAPRRPDDALLYGSMFDLIEIEHYAVFVLLHPLGKRIVASADIAALASAWANAIVIGSESRQGCRQTQYAQG